MLEVNKICRGKITEHIFCKNKGTFSCATCNNHWYCSTQCQWRSWEDHREYCRVHTKQISFNYKPVFTLDPFKDDAEDTLIVVYSRYIDLKNKLPKSDKKVYDPIYNETFLITWILNNFSHEKDPLSLPMRKAQQYYSFLEMDDMAKFIVKFEDPSFNLNKIKKVIFYEYPDLLSIQGVIPFINNEEDEEEEEQRIREENNIKSRIVKKY